MDQNRKGEEREKVGEGGGGAGKNRTYLFFSTGLSDGIVMIESEEMRQQAMWGLRHWGVREEEEEEIEGERIQDTQSLSHLLIQRCRRNHYGRKGAPSDQSERSIKGPIPDAAGWKENGRGKAIVAVKGIKVLGVLTSEMNYLP